MDNLSIVLTKNKQKKTGNNLHLQRFSKYLLQKILRICYKTWLYLYVNQVKLNLQKIWLVIF